MLILIYFILILLSLIGVKFLKGNFNLDYLSIKQCNAVKGFFIIIVFIGHINQYIVKTDYVANSLGDVAYFRITSAIGQLMVTMFLFFSGYGIMESFKRKGVSYINSMPRKRILTTLINFDIAVLCFLVLNTLLGKSMPISKILLSFFAWDSLGNSNWYIFCILLCYSFAYTVLHFFKDNKHLIYISIFSLTINTVIILSYYKQPWWYNTMLCFPFGMLYSGLKERMDIFLHKHYFKSLFVFVVLFLIARYIPINLKGLVYNIESIFFVMIVLLVMIRTELNNIYLQWMGQKLFPLYIYQRLMMITIYELPSGKEFIASYPLLYFILCLGCVILIASQYNRWQINLSLS